MWFDVSAGFYGDYLLFVFGDRNLENGIRNGVRTIKQRFGGTFCIGEHNIGGDFIHVDRRDLSENGKIWLDGGDGKLQRELQRMIFIQMRFERSAIEL